MYQDGFWKFVKNQNHEVVDGTATDALGDVIMGLTEEYANLAK